MLYFAKTPLNRILVKSGAGVGHNLVAERKLRTLTKKRRTSILCGHVPYTQQNDQTLRRYIISPRVLLIIRPLPDVVVSYRDHLDAGYHGPLDPRVGDAKEGSIAWSAWDEKTKHDYLIDFVMPWYVRFISGWLQVAEEWSLFPVTFEEHTTYPIETLTSIFRFFYIDSKLTNESYSPVPEDTARLGGRVNFNVGEHGRGFKLLTAHQHERLEMLLAYLGSPFLGSSMGRYLLHGFSVLDFSVEDLVAAKLDPECELLLLKQRQPKSALENRSSSDPTSLSIIPSSKSFAH